MAQGDKSGYSDKQKRMAQHIEDSYEKKGAKSKDAGRIAWATVNKETGGARGKKKTKKSRSRSSKKTRSKRTKRARVLH